MPNNKLNNKIIALARSSPDMGRLQGIESRVWRAINKRRAATPRNIVEEWLATVFTPEYRIAFLSLGLIVGVLTAFLSMSAPQTANAAAALNLHVFSSSYGVTSNIISEKAGEKT